MSEKKSSAPPDVLSCRMDLAKEHGVDVAIFLHYLQFLVKTNKAAQRNFREGRYWSYGSMQFFSEMFPCWSAKQIRRIIETCRVRELVVVGNFNETKHDRTIWYTLSDEMLAAYGIEVDSQTGECNCPNGQMDMPELDDGFEQTGECNCPNGQMDMPELADGFAQTGEPLPVSNPVSNPVNTPIPPKGGKRGGGKKTKDASDWKPERFEAFWEFYSKKARGENRRSAISAWDKLRPSDELILEMGKGLRRQLASEDWRRGIGIPYAATWLNNARWRDGSKAVPQGDGSGGPNGRQVGEEAFGWK